MIYPVYVFDLIVIYCIIRLFTDFLQNRVDVGVAIIGKFDCYHPMCQLRLMPRPLKGSRDCYGTWPVKLVYYLLSIHLFHTE